MRIGITLGHTGETVRDVAAYAAEAEAAGLDHVGFSDSQSVFRETYCMMTAAALATSRIGLVTTATNVTLRDPVLTACSIATVDEVSDGRAFLGIGTGASSVKNIGKERAKPRELRAGVERIRQAFDQSLAVQAAGRSETDTVLLSYAKRAVPVLVSCSTGGPLAIKIAAECGNGVMLQGDLSLDVLRDRVERIRAIRAASPRADEPFDMWLYAPGWIADTEAECRDAVGGVVASLAAAILDPDVPEHAIPEELREPFREFVRRYRFAEHASPEHAAIMDEVGVADHLYERLALVGTPETFAARLTELEDIGFDALVMTGYVPDKHVLIERVGRLAAALAA